VEDTCSGSGTKPQGVWRLCPEDEAKCYMHVQVLTISCKKFRFNGDKAGWSCRLGRRYKQLRRPALPAQGADGRSAPLKRPRHTTPTTALIEVICCLNCGFCKTANNWYPVPAQDRPANAHMYMTRDSVAVEK